MQKIAVIGAGLMGHGIAQIFAVHGHDVTLVDLDEIILGSATAGIRNNLELMADHDFIAPEQIDAALSRVSTTTDTEKGVNGADFVVEAVVENLEVKQNIFKKLDQLCPTSTILASNTSVISITEIARESEEKKRIVGTHFWNPPHLIPLVEVVPGAETLPETVDATYELLLGVGKHPVKVKKDVPGFVANRLQHALWREAISIVENDIADAATVDECIKFGFGLRLPALGPMENSDMVGNDLVLAIHDYILKHIESSPDPSPLLRNKVAKGELGFKSGQGFQSWSEEEIAVSRKSLQQYLLRVVKDM
ncbi:MAG: 3-hydroxyacyl-CoA dehydrogenase family protein [Desulfobacterales bacterium]|nr:3-hydroxyacyl-CoA dehydrogenase family protein [Desulfofustis sp.]NNK92736.1 3-hydroxyacyl-CoA dehydrogenase family protein [Desulfobacterales bacterium]